MCYLTRVNSYLLAYHLGRVEAYYECKTWLYLMSIKATLAHLLTEGVQMFSLLYFNGITLFQYIGVLLGKKKKQTTTNDCTMGKICQQLKLVFQSEAVSFCPVRRNAV